MPSSDIHQWAYDLSKQLIDANGRYMTIAWRVRVESDSAAVGDGVSVTRSKTIVGVQTSFKDEERNEWAIDTGDIAMILDGEVKPTTGMKLYEGKSEDIDLNRDRHLRIKNVGDVKPGTLAAIYRIQAGA